jgi:hypothetical protein
LTEEDANRSGLVGVLMRVRRQHSATDHPDFVDALSAADVALECAICATVFDVLDINVTSLANEIMACRADHERTAHA